MLEKSLLSVRARDIHEDDKSINRMWDTLDNLWDPQENPGGIVSLGVAENRLMHAELRSFINNNFSIENHAFTYGDGSQGSKRLRRAMAAFFNQHFDPVREVLPSHINVTSGVSNANEVLAWLLGDPGDGFLLGRPYYGTFIMDFRVRAGVDTVAVAFGDVDPLSLAAVAQYEEALVTAERRGRRIRALILGTPHNPLGRCYPREVMIELMKLCQKHQIHFVSDEIYALSVWKNPEAPDATEFTSALSIDLTGIIDSHLVHVLWGLSKDFGANGLRIGAIISQSNNELRRELRTLNLFSYPSAASDHAACLLLENKSFTDTYIATNRARITRNYAVATSFLRKHNIPYVEGCNAAFFLWVNLLAAVRRRRPAAGPAELVLLKAKLAEMKVALADGDGFGGEICGYFRIVFTHPQDYLLEGLKRVVIALRSVMAEEPKARL